MTSPYREPAETEDEVPEEKKPKKPRVWSPYEIVWLAWAALSIGFSFAVNEGSCGDRLMNHPVRALLVVAGVGAVLPVAACVWIWLWKYVSKYDTCNKCGGDVSVRVNGFTCGKCIRKEEKEAQQEASDRIQELEECARGLYQIIDDVDTLGDSMKPEHSPYFLAVQAAIRRREKFGASDGQRVKIRLRPGSP